MTEAEFSWADEAKYEAGYEAGWLAAAEGTVAFPPYEVAGAVYEDGYAAAVIDWMRAHG